MKREGRAGDDAGRSSVFQTNHCLTFVWDFPGRIEFQVSKMGIKVYQYQDSGTNVFIYIYIYTY